MEKNRNGKVSSAIVSEEPVRFLFAHPEADADKQGQLLERVVAERALELRDDERPETAWRGGGVRRPAVAALWRGKLASGVVSGITTAKPTTPATNCELKNFHPTSFVAMERESEVSDEP
jgi:hypothetical protein